MSQPRIQLQHVSKRFACAPGSGAPADALANISITLEPG